MFLKSVLAFLLLLLPSQLGRHFWPRQAFVFGLKIDYLSPTLYLQDVLILLLLVTWFWRQKKFLSKGKFWFFFGLYCCLSVGNLFSSLTPLLSFFGWLRITEMIVLGIFFSQNSRQVYSLLHRFLAPMVIFESFLGFCQVIKQSSLGGFFWFLGERTFNIFTPGIARASWWGHLRLRPYGTFSHPNSLAGFTVICLIFLLSKRRLSFSEKMAVILGVLLIILAFSRTVWLTCFVLGMAGLLFLLAQGLRKSHLRLSFPYWLMILALPLLALLFTRTMIEESSIVNRIRLANLAYNIIKTSPFFGVGVNNFIIALARISDDWSWLYWLQPVHNIFLLSAAETGLVGLTIFSVFLLLTLQRLLSFLLPYFASPKQKKDSQLGREQIFLLLSLLAILLTGLFDHYWLTLIQNQLLFVLVLGLSWSQEDDKISL